MRSAVLARGACAAAASSRWRADPTILVVGHASRLSIHPTARVDSFVKIEVGHGVSIGAYVHVCSFAHVGYGGGETVIDDYATVASGGVVMSGSNLDTGWAMNTTAPPELWHAVRALTVIGRRAFVACRAVVLPGRSLGEGAVLAAGAVATRDVPANEVWAGVPARFLRHRVVDPETVPAGEMEVEP